MPDAQYFKCSIWVCAVQEWAESVEREWVLVILKNTYTNLFLVIIYKSNNDISFVSWGIEAGDTKEQTVYKELSEEVGISKLSLIKELPDRYFKIAFYSPYRQRNNIRNTHVFYAETDEISNDISENEKIIQTPHRYTIHEIQEYIKQEKIKATTDYEMMEYILKKIQNTWL